MRPVALFALLLGLAACGTPPLDAERRPPPPPVLERPVPPRPEPPRPEPPAAATPPPVVAPPPSPIPQPLPEVPSASITLQSVYPEVGLAEWELANGGHVLFERVADQPLRMLAVAPGGAAGLDSTTAAGARAASYARSTNEYGRFEIGDVSRRIVAYGSLRVLGVFLGEELGFGASASSALSAPRSASTSLPPEAVFAAQSVPDRREDDRMFREAVGMPGRYVVAVVGDAEIEEIEAYIAGAFAAGGRVPLPFIEPEPAIPDSAEVVDSGTGEDVSTLVYRGRLRRSDSQATIELAATAAADALRADGFAASSWGRADAVAGTYEVAIAVSGPGAVLDIGERLTRVNAPADLVQLRAERAARSRGLGVPVPDRGAPQHLVSWHARGGAPLRYDSYSAALASVSRDELAETMRHVFGAGSYRAVLGLDLTL